MSEELVGPLRQVLLTGAVDEDLPGLHIDEVAADDDDARLIVRVVFSEQEQRGDFERIFDDVDMKMLTEATPELTAVAIASWVRLELAEHVSELAAAGRWHSAG